MTSLTRMNETWTATAYKTPPEPEYMALTYQEPICPFCEFDATKEEPTPGDWDPADDRRIILFVHIKDAHPGHIWRFTAGVGGFHFIVMDIP